MNKLPLRSGVSVSVGNSTAGTSRMVNLNGYNAQE